ncbi:MAG: energy-coupling factor ABC transporter permease [Cloacibacillus sp.]
MHMADALLSPSVGLVMCAASAGAVAWSVSKIKKEGLCDQKIPLMAVTGAFVFAAQMINFTIPATGSSGHIGGGVLLAAMLGGAPALLSIAAVLMIQALFFADGGLLALGANIFNMGVIPCLFVYPLLFAPIVRRGLTKKNIMVASMLSVVVGLQLGAFAVVLETLASGITALPFSTFALLMQPIHAAIGVVEGLVTASILSFVAQARPEILECGKLSSDVSAVSFKKVLVALVAATAITGGALSLFASAYPDGLEWAMEKTAGAAALETSGPVFAAASAVQAKTALMPDYAYAGTERGTSAAGLIGSALTFAAAGGAGWLISKNRQRRA